MASADEEVAVTDEVIVLKILLTVLFFVFLFFVLVFLSGPVCR